MSRVRQAGCAETPSSLLGQCRGVGEISSAGPLPAQEGESAQLNTCTHGAAARGQGDEKHLVQRHLAGGARRAYDPGRCSVNILHTMSTFSNSLQDRFHFLWLI